MMHRMVDGRCLGCRHVTVCRVEPADLMNDVERAEFGAGDVFYADCGRCGVDMPHAAVALLAGLERQRAR